MIGILDYGLGNIIAFKCAFDNLNIPSRIISNISDFDGCKNLILPGVGSFDNAMYKLRNSGLFTTLEDYVQRKETPILGVCVGMQILFDSSEEGASSGLGWIKGEVKALQNIKKTNLPIPHMGWNTISSSNSHKLTSNLSSNEFYFLHSYSCIPEDDSIIAAKVQYNDNLCCSIQSGLICGTQFHPEKSHGAGLEILSNFYRFN